MEVPGGDFVVLGFLKQLQEIEKTKILFKRLTSANHGEALYIAVLRICVDH